MARDFDLNRYSSSDSPWSSPREAADRLTRQVSAQQERRNTGSAWNAISDYREKAQKDMERRRAERQRAEAEAKAQVEKAKQEKFQQSRYTGDDVMKGASIGGSLGGPWGALGGAIAGSIIGTGRSIAGGFEQGIDPAENIGSALLGHFMPGGVTWDPSTGDPMFTHMPSDVGSMEAGNYADAMGANMGGDMSGMFDDMGADESAAGGFDTDYGNYGADLGNYGSQLTTPDAFDYGIETADGYGGGPLGEMQLTPPGDFDWGGGGGGYESDRILADSSEYEGQYGFANNESLLGEEEKLLPEPLITEDELPESAQSTASALGLTDYDRRLRSLLERQRRGM